MRDVLVKLGSEFQVLYEYNIHREPVGSHKNGEKVGGRFAPAAIHHSFSDTIHTEHWQAIANEAIASWLKTHDRIYKETVALVDDIDAMMREAENHTDYRFWYLEHRPLAIELFGKNEPLFEKFLAASSINSAGMDNVKKAIRATIHHLSGKKFDMRYRRVMPEMRKQFQYIANNSPLRGPKVVPFYKALMGDFSQTPTDRHMKDLLFQHPTGGAKDTLAGASQVVITAMAEKLHWYPAELQAVLWVVQKARRDAKDKRKGLGGEVFTYYQYLKQLEVKTRAQIELVNELHEEAEENSLEFAADIFSKAQLIMIMLVKMRKAKINETVSLSRVSLGRVSIKKRIGRGTTTKHDSKSTSKSEKTTPSTSMPSLGDIIAGGKK